MTKLDGGARGGVLVALAEMYTIRVPFIGIGEGIDDLRRSRRPPSRAALPVRTVNQAVTLARSANR